MPRQKGAFWNEYELDEDDLEAEKYRCKHCNTKYVKNASRLQTYLEKLSIDGFTYKYSESDQKALENLLTRAFCLAGISFNVIENEDVKAVFQK
ncbi:14322_t:CDS:2, partial [Gigaspora rosea]